MTTNDFEHLRDADGFYPTNISSLVAAQGREDKQKTLARIGKAVRPF